VKITSVTKHVKFSFVRFIAFMLASMLAGRACTGVGQGVVRGFARYFPYCGYVVQVYKHTKSKNKEKKREIHHIVGTKGPLTLSNLSKNAKTRIK